MKEIISYKVANYTTTSKEDAINFEEKLKFWTQALHEISVLCNQRGSCVGCPFRVNDECYFDTNSCYDWREAPEMILDDERE